MESVDSQPTIDRRTACMPVDTSYRPKVGRSSIDVRPTIIDSRWRVIDGRLTVDKQNPGK